LVTQLRDATHQVELAELAQPAQSPGSAEEKADEKAAGRRQAAYQASDLFVRLGRRVPEAPSRVLVGILGAQEVGEHREHRLGIIGPSRNAEIDFGGGPAPVARLEGGDSALDFLGPRLCAVLRR